MQYLIPGPPVPRSFPVRISRSALWSSQKQMRTVWETSLANQHDNKPLLLGPLHFEAVFFMPHAQRLSAPKQKHKAGLPHYNKPDLSEYIQWVFDRSIGIIIPDDATISSIVAAKVYSTDPRTEFSFLPFTVKAYE